MKNNHIIPTVFSHNKRGFETRFKKIIKISDKIHIDIMDGRFVSARSVFLKDILDLKRYKKMFEAHLMIENPKELFPECKKKGFTRVIFHIEASRNEKDALGIIDEGKKLGLQVYVAINPSTNLRHITYLVKNKRCDGVLLLGVHPGKEGQKMSSKIPGRIRQIKKINKKMIVQIDGGVNNKDIKNLSKAGADEINSGSFIASSKNPAKSMEYLEVLFDEGKVSR